jgi:hypothetical protein
LPNIKIQEPKGEETDEIYLMKSSSKINKYSGKLFKGNSLSKNHKEKDMYKLNELIVTNKIFIFRIQLKRRTI